MGPGDTRGGDPRLRLEAEGEAAGQDRPDRAAPEPRAADQTAGRALRRPQARAPGPGPGARAVTPPGVAAAAPARRPRGAREGDRLAPPGGDLRLLRETPEGPGSPERLPA